MLILLWAGLALLLGFVAFVLGGILGLLSTLYCGTAVLAYREGPLMKTLLRLFGKFTRWYITLIIFMACLLFIIITLGKGLSQLYLACRQFRFSGCLGHLH
jgi:hypothetical protein